MVECDVVLVCFDGVVFGVLCEVECVLVLYVGEC